MQDRRDGMEIRAASFPREAGEVSRVPRSAALVLWSVGGFIQTNLIIPLKGVPEPIGRGRESREVLLRGHPPPAPGMLRAKMDKIR